MKVQMNVTLKLANGTFCPIGFIFDGPLESFPGGVQYLVKIKSLQVTVIEDNPKMLIKSEPVKKVIKPKKLVKKIKK